MSGIYYAVVEDDPLDSGGNSRVIEGASHSSIEGPDGRSRAQTYLGHKAWCATCQSVGTIVAGAGMSDFLRAYDSVTQTQEAVSGDMVLCKCERHPRIISVYARSCEYIDTSSVSGTVAAVPPTPQQRLIYSQQFTLLDVNQYPLADTYYTFVSEDILTHGVTDASGRTARYKTEDKQNIRVYLGHREPIRNV